MAYSPRSGQNISRQFTDSELALDDRITSHLTAPPLNPAIGGSMGQTYQWLKEDMALRSTMTDQLAQEQGLAYQQSSRHELARQAEKQESNDVQALDAMKRINGLIASGRSFNQAAHEVVSNTEGAALNGRLSSMIAEGSKYYESPEDQEYENLKRGVDVLKLGTEKFDLEAADQYRRENPEAARSMVDSIKKKVETEGLTAANANLAAQAEQIKRGMELDDLEERKNSWMTNSDIGDDPANVDKLVLLHNSFAKAGLDGVEAPEKIVKNFPGQAVIGMLANRGWLESKTSTPEAKQQLVEAINVANSEDPGLDPKLKTQARNTIFRLAGEHQEYIASAQSFKERGAALDSISKEAATSYKDASKAITDVLTNATLNKAGDTGEIQDTKPMIISAAKGFVDQFRIQAGGDPQLESLLDQYSGFFDGISDAASPQAAAKEARDMMGDFARKFSSIRSGKTGVDPSKALKGAKDIDPVTAQRFLRESGGDRNKARQAAKDAGYTF